MTKNEAIVSGSFFRVMFGLSILECRLGFRSCGGRCVAVRCYLIY